MEYGFYGRLKEEFPSQIIVDLNEACNYSCIHCPQGQMKKDGRITGAKLSKELNKKMVDEVAEYGRGCTQQIRYTADGEPFLHPDIMEILEYAICNSGTMVTVTTNGSLLDEDKTRHLLDIGLGLIDFSLDAYNDDTYAEIRRNGNLEKVRNNVLRMLELRKEINSKTKIIVSFVLQEKNKDEKDAFIKYWEEKGVDKVIIRKLHSAGGSMATIDDVAKNKVYPCVYLWERISLNQHGHITYCPTDWDGTRVICDDYSKTTIKEIWTGDLMNEYRRQHLTNSFECNNPCKDCPDRLLTIWPDNGQAAYGDMINDFSKGKE